MSFHLSRRSLNRLGGVHPDLAEVVMCAIEITEIDFGVIEGLRSLEKQKALVAAGASRTMNSRHLTGHAVDLVAFVGNEVRYDWPLYQKIADAMMEAAHELGVAITWGGDWDGDGDESDEDGLRDGPHFELDWGEYPA